MQIMIANSGVFTFVTVAVSAAATESEPATVDVPFDFMVGERVLRAGNYAVEPSPIPGNLLFHSQEVDAQPVLVQAINYDNSSEFAVPQQLLFLVQQNTYYLGQALMATV